MLLREDFVVALIERYRHEIAGYSTAQIEAVVHEEILRDLKQSLKTLAQHGDSWARAEYERRYGPLAAD
ncbi:MAG TPA: hypothetical protein VEW06_06535 [Xanthobacteraceae bacterium]|nr:hypothetical protein [Xanthobacteraceae bacterium]